MIIHCLDSGIQILNSLSKGRGSIHGSNLAIILINKICKCSMGGTSIALIGIVYKCSLSSLQSSLQSLHLKQAHDIGEILHLDISDSVTVTKTSRISIQVTSNQTNHEVAFSRRCESDVESSIFLILLDTTIDNLEVLSNDSTLINNSTILSANSVLIQDLNTQCTVRTLRRICIPLSRLQSQMIGLTTCQCQLIVFLSTIQSNTCLSTALSQIKDISSVTCLTMLQTVTCARIGWLHARIRISVVNISSNNPTSATSIITIVRKVRCIEYLRLVITTSFYRTEAVRIDDSTIKVIVTVSHCMIDIQFLHATEVASSSTLQSNGLREVLSSRCCKFLLIKCSLNRAHVNLLIEGHRKLAQVCRQIERTVLRISADQFGSTPNI